MYCFKVSFVITDKFLSSWFIGLLCVVVLWMREIHRNNLNILKRIISC